MIYFQNLYEWEDDEKEEIEPLTSYLWYHGAIDRKATKDLLLNHRYHGDGTFLVRASGQGPLALSFM